MSAQPSGWLVLVLVFVLLRGRASLAQRYFCQELTQRCCWLLRRVVVPPWPRLFPAARLLGPQVRAVRLAPQLGQPQIAEACCLRYRSVQLQWAASQVRRWQR